MKFLDFFRSLNPGSAATAKERLQIIIAHERRRVQTPDYLPLMQREILAVVRKYVPISEDQIKLNIDRRGELEVLELNISLTEPPLEP